MILALLNIVVLLGKGEYESANEKCKLNYLTLRFEFCKEKPMRGCPILRPAEIERESIG